MLMDVEAKMVLTSYDQGEFDQAIFKYIDDQDKSAQDQQGCKSQYL